MAILINSQNCDSTRLNLGMPSCLASMKDPVGFILTPTTWSATVASDTIDLAYVLGKIQDGTFIPFLDSLEFLDNTPEPTTKEYTSGLKSVIRNGKPEFSFEFSKEYAFHKSAYTYNTNGAYNVIFVTSNGSLFLAQNTAGTTLQGFSLGMLNTGSFKFNDGGSEVEKTVISFQLTDENQFNGKGVILTQETLGFAANSEIFPITDVLIAGTAADAGDVVVSVTARANPVFYIEGLEAANFRLLIGGVVDTITGVTYSATTNLYSITPTTSLSSSSCVVEMYDAGNSVDVADATTAFYKGESDAIVSS